MNPLKLKKLFSGEAESVATDHGRFHAKNSCGTSLFDETLNFASHKEAILHIACRIKYASAYCSTALCCTRWL